MSKLISFANDILNSESLQKDFMQDPEQVMKARGLSGEQIAMLKDRKKTNAIKAITEELNSYEKVLKNTHRNSW
ncbi:MAG TPA: hypothetical protein VJ385_04485 [Fibrobacteria bacterium]|nr:hypothetical protein [Fibrobacteria bacterium]